MPTKSPVWVKRVGFVMSAVCPVYPQQQTSPDTVGTSHLCQERTPQQIHVVSALPLKADSSRTLLEVRFAPTAEVAVAAYSIKSLAPRRDGASFRKPCFAETIDIHLTPRYTAARHPFRNAKIGFELEQTGRCLPCFCFAS